MTTSIVGSVLGKIQGGAAETGIPPPCSGRPNTCANRVSPVRVSRIVTAFRSNILMAGRDGYGGLRWLTIWLARNVQAPWSPASCRKHDASARYVAGRHRKKRLIWEPQTLGCETRRDCHAQVYEVRLSGELCQRLRSLDWLSRC